MAGVLLLLSSMAVVRQLSVLAAVHLCSIHQNFVTSCFTRSFRHVTTPCAGPTAGGAAEERRGGAAGPAGQVGRLQLSFVLFVAGSSQQLQPSLSSFLGSMLARTLPTNILPVTVMLSALILMVQRDAGAGGAAVGGAGAGAGKCPAVLRCAVGCGRTAMHGQLSAVESRPGGVVGCAWPLRFIAEPCQYEHRDPVLC